MTKEISLTQGKVALVDDADYDWLSQWKWCTLRTGPTRRKYYAARSEYKPRRRTVFMHVEIVKPSEGMEIDHQDGDGLNNQRHNLREATRAQNSKNRKMSRNSTTGFAGVTYYPKGKKYRAQINCNGRHYYIGSYSTPEKAARAYDLKARELFGEFARLNFPDHPIGEDIKSQLEDLRERRQYFSQPKPRAEKITRLPRISINQGKQPKEKKQRIIQPPKVYIPKIRKRQVNNTSGYIGVDKNRGRWRARVDYQGKKIHVYYGPDLQAAARAYDAKARELFGPLASLNFPG